MAKSRAYLGKSNLIEQDAYIAVRSALEKEYELSKAEPPYDYHYIEGREVPFFMVPSNNPDEEFEDCGKGIFGEIKYCLDNDIPASYILIEEGKIVEYMITDVTEYDDKDKGKGSDAWAKKFGYFDIDVYAFVKHGDVKKPEKKKGFVKPFDPSSYDNPGDKSLDDNLFIV